jgi:hypothetical protein
VPVVREELVHGVDNHPYLQSALDTLADGIQVTTISDTVANREAVVSDHLDPGEAQTFALADAEDGRLLTDDVDPDDYLAAYWEYDRVPQALGTHGGRNVLETLCVESGIRASDGEVLKPHAARRGLGKELYQRLW